MLYFTIYTIRTNQTENGTDRESERSNFPNNHGRTLDCPRLLFLRWIEIAEMYKRKSVEIFHFLEVNENSFYDIKKKKKIHTSIVVMAMRAYIRVRAFLTRVPSPNIFPRTKPVRMPVNALILEQNRNPRFYSKLVRNTRKYRDTKMQTEKRWKQKYDRLEANVSAVFFSPFTLLKNLEGDGERRSRVLFSTKEKKEWKVGRTVNSTIEPVRFRCHPRM